MYKLFKNFFLPGIALIALSALYSGCDKKDVYPAQQLPAITTVTPGSGIPGTTITIKGTNLKSVTSVKFGIADAANFTASSVTDTAIVVKVPDIDSGQMYIQVYVKDGKGYKAAPFTVLPKPRVPDITEVLPAVAFPGDAVTIKGINLDVVTDVKFGNVSAASFTAATNKIDVNVPATAAGGTQKITVVAPTGTDTISFKVDLSPVITSVAPTNAQEGDVVTVNGVRFTNASAVKLGNMSVAYTVVNDGKITFTVPVGAVTGKVTVTTPNGSGTSSANVVIPVAGFKLVIYDDAIQGGFSKWGGWGGDADENNTTPVKSGTKSVKIHYAGQWGSPLQLGGASIDLTQYSTFKISIYGGPGTTGRTVNIGFSGQDGKTLTLTEGQWTNFQIPISEITTATTLTEIWIKEYSGVTGVDELIYVDDIGLN